MKKAFEMTSDPAWIKKVFNFGRVQWSEFIERPWDYYDASSGSVSGCIYYSDTVKFGKKNHLTILKKLAEFESECGQLKKPDPTNETQYFNWLAWFAWENMASELINILENE